jgi:hypothetical protein
VKSEVAHKIGHVKLESAEILKSFENLKVVLNTIKQTNIITYNKSGNSYPWIQDGLVWFYGV